MNWIKKKQVVVTLIVQTKKMRLVSCLFYVLEIELSAAESTPQSQAIFTLE